MQEQVLQQYKEAITKRLSFTLHLYRGKPSSQGPPRLIIAHFKPAGSEHINPKTPLVGVPGQVAWKSGGEAGHLYFVTVQKDEESDDRWELGCVQPKCAKQYPAGLLYSHGLAPC